MCISNTLIICAQIITDKSEGVCELSLTAVAHQVGPLSVLGLPPEEKKLSVHVE